MTTQPGFTWSNLFHKGFVDGERNPAIFLHTNMWFASVSDSADSPNHHVSGGVRLPADAWFHFAISHKPNEYRLYLNGAITDTNTAIQGPVERPNAPFYFSDPWYPTLNGVVGDFRYWPWVAPPSVIATLAQGVPGETAA